MKKAFLVLLVLGFAVLMSTPAFADSCTVDNPPTDFCLNNPNNASSSAAEISVHITFDGVDQLNVHIADAGSNTIKGIDMVAFTSDGQFFTASGTPGGWDPGTASVDGFSDYFSGTFSQAKDPGGTDTDITFTLSGDPGFDEDTVFVVHVRYDDADGTGCSLFLSNKPRIGDLPPGDFNCGGTEVPEPGSLALLGTGLFSAVGVLRRKFGKA